MIFMVVALTICCLILIASLWFAHERIDRMEARMGRTNERLAGMQKRVSDGKRISDDK